MTEDRASFLRFCMDLLPKGHAQAMQDLFALWSSGCAQTGWFVEFGALNGITVSNSFLLEQLGWQGIVAEPHPDYAERLRSNRACHVSTDCVWTQSGVEIPFKLVKGRPALSTIASIEHDDIQEAAGRRDAHRLYNVRSISLVDLLDQFDAPAQIDLLSIDTEGSELDILRAFDFRRARFATIVVEHGYSSQRDPIHALLSAQGYHRVWRELSDHDDWYVHASTAERMEHAPDGYAVLSEQFSKLPNAEGVAQRLRRFAALLGKLDRPDEALRAMHEAVAHNGTENAVMHVELARCLLAVGQPVRAIEAYRRALDIDPSLKPARAQLARLLARGRRAE